MSIAAQIRNVQTRSLFCSLRATHSAHGCQSRMQTWQRFFSFVVTWSSALLDGKILGLVCSGDSTQPSKVIQGGFFEGRLNLYPATPSTFHFFMSPLLWGTCLNIVYAIWNNADPAKSSYFCFSAQMGLIGKQMLALPFMFNWHQLKTDITTQA